MRGRIILTAVLLVGLLAGSGGAVAAPQSAPDAGVTVSDADVTPDCLDLDGDGECDYCWNGEEYVPC